MSLYLVGQKNLTTKEHINALLQESYIDSIEKLKRFPELDSALTRVMIGPVDRTKTITYYVPQDIKICKSKHCDTWTHLVKIFDIDIINLDKTMQHDACSNECKNCPYNNAICKKTRINPKLRYNLYNKKRSARLLKKRFSFSKIHIKLILLLQAWPTELISKTNDYDALLSNVYIPDLAKILNCNPEYLEDCLNELGNAFLLTLKKTSPHNYDVVLHNYFLKFQKANQGGAGYIQINHNILSSLLVEKNINTLRGKLLQLLENPMAVYLDPSKLKVIRLEEFKQVMPKYVNYSNEYKKALDNDLFAMEYDERSKIFVFGLKQMKESIYELKQNIVNKGIQIISAVIKDISFVTKDNSFGNEQYHGSIDKLISKNINTIPEKVRNNAYLLSFLKDAALMCLDFGLPNVVKAILQLEHSWNLFGTQILNAGGLLRTKCINNKLQCNI